MLLLSLVKIALSVSITISTHIIGEFYLKACMDVCMYCCLSSIKQSLNVVQARVNEAHVALLKFINERSFDVITSLVF